MSPSNRPIRNRLIASLSPAELRRILPCLRRTTLKSDHVLFDRDEPITDVYFVERGVVSLTNRLNDGTIVEVATVGNEGMVGLPVFLRGNRFTLTAFTQVPGEAYRMSAADLLRLTQDRSGLRTNLSRYVQAMLTQIAQAATCNRIHSLEKRCARWLLMTHDRAAADRFLLTPKFLRQMLGTPDEEMRRAVTYLRKHRLISYAGRVLTIKDRERLEDLSCECYAVIRREFERLIGQDPPPVNGNGRH